MNKLLIQSIMAGVVLLAGTLTFIPIERVSTVHTTIISTISADIDAQDRFMTIGIPAGASNIPLTPITLAKTDGYAGFATIVVVVTTSAAGKTFKLEADTDGDGNSDTTIASVSLSPPSGTRIATGNIPNGTDRLFISSAGATVASFSASITIQFDSIMQ